MPLPSPWGGGAMIERRASSSMTMSTSATKVPSPGFSGDAELSRPHAGIQHVIELGDAVGRWPVAQNRHRALYPVAENESYRSHPAPDGRSVDHDAGLQSQRITDGRGQRFLPRGGHLPSPITRKQFDHLLGEGCVWATGRIGCPAR